MNDISLAIWVFFRKRQKKKPISLSSISKFDNLNASPLKKDTPISQISRSAGERLYLELGSGAPQSAMMSSSESCSSLTNSMSSEDLNVVIHECLSRGLRELKMGLDLSGYDGSRSGKRSRHHSTTNSYRIWKFASQFCFYTKIAWFWASATCVESFCQGSEWRKPLNLQSQSTYFILLKLLRGFMNKKAAYAAFIEHLWNSNSGYPHRYSSLAGVTGALGLPDRRSASSI